ncbi:MAG TPA: MarR family transcriptional regulator [Vicinamibacterales bacterium]|nr:MarR family transcriptional regulator [Vicinamibacterales bacterium]
MTIDQAVERVQFAYPQVYYACHTRHARRRSNPFRLSPRDSEILVHLDSRDPMTLSTLARHMDLARSTLSEAVTTLEALGYVTKSAGTAGDRRHIGLVLTSRGVEAVRGSSVLESWRLRAVFGRLTARQRTSVVQGLDLLARASRPSPARKAG